MNNNRALKLFLLVSLLLNFSIKGGAGYFYYRENFCSVTARAEKRQAAFAKKLGLSPEQREMMGQEEQRFRSAAEGARKELIEKRKGLLKVLSEEEPDRAAIDTILSEIVATQGRIEAQAVEHILNEKSVLDKEQKARFMGLLEKRLGAHSHAGRRGFVQ